MTKDETWENIMLQTGLNEKVDSVEAANRNLDFDAALMSQRMAVEKAPSGLIKLDNHNTKDHF